MILLGFTIHHLTSLSCETRFRGPSNFCAESLGLYGAMEKSRTNLKTTLVVNFPGKINEMGCRQIKVANMHSKKGEGAVNFNFFSDNDINGSAFGIYNDSNKQLIIPLVLFTPRQTDKSTDFIHLMVSVRPKRKKCVI